MASFNRVILVGNLTRDVELKYTQGGTAVTEVTLAVNDRRKNQSGEWIEETTFVDVTLWARTAEVASEYLSKGSPLLIEGRLRLDRWDDKETGKGRSKLAVTANNMQMLGGRGGGNGGGSGGGNSSGRQGQYSQPAAAPEPTGQTGPPDDEIPF